MSFKTIRHAAPKIKSRPLAKALVRISGRGKSLQLFLSTFLTDKIKVGKETGLSAQFGFDESEGLIRLVAPLSQDEETFDINNGVGGSLRVTLPGDEISWLPNKTTESAPCEVREESEEHIILRLPLEEWSRSKVQPKKQPTTPLVTSLAPPPRPAPEPRGLPFKSDDRLDVAEYLTKKGFKIRRLAEGRFTADGDPATLGDLLELVNSFRRRDELPPLLEKDVK